MLAFVTSLRHPDNAVDYQRVERLLRGTLTSVTSQSVQDYVVVVVGNVRPSFPLPPRVRFVEVGFASPQPADGPHAGRDAFVRDKGSKIGVGLVAVRDEADYAMIFDADDFVHRDLAAWTRRHPGRPGWFICDGWMYSGATGEAMPITGFNRTCGTSLILPMNAFGVPDGLPLEATQDEVVSAYGDVLPEIMGAHRNAVSWLAGRGRELRALPFPGAVYHVDTGENHSGKRLRDHARHIGSSTPDYFPRPMRRSVARQYAIQLSRRQVVTWWASNWREVPAISRSARRSSRPA